MRWRRLSMGSMLLQFRCGASTPTSISYTAVPRYLDGVLSAQSVMGVSQSTNLRNGVNWEAFPPRSLRLDRHQTIADYVSRPNSILISECITLLESKFSQIVIVLTLSISRTK